MTVSNEKIITKMIAELQSAKAVNNDFSKIRIHLEKVQVLNELLLDNSVSDTTKHDVHQQFTEQSPMRVVQTEPGIAEEQGDSIFDF